MEPLVEKLVERARTAKERSQEVVAHAAALADRREESARRPRRCAWCGRVNVGGVWRDEKDLPAFFKARRDPDSATNGICESCFDGLRAGGRSW